MKNIGYFIMAEYNYSNMIDDTIPVHRCNSCGLILEKPYINPNFKIKKRFDLSYTFDGYMIASDKFIEAWEEAKGKGMSFTPLIKAPGYYLVNVEKYVEYDQENNKVKFLEFNNCCQTYTQIITGTPGSFNCAHKIEKFGAALSDLKFGQGDHKINLLYVSLSIGDNLKKYKKLTGIYSKIVKVPDQK